MQFVILDPIHADGLKGSKPNVKCDLCGLDASLSKPRKNFWGEVQACGWCRYRAAFARVDGLIAIAISGAVWPINVRWQRHMP